MPSRSRTRVRRLGGQVLRLQDVQFGDGLARLAGAQKLDGQFEAQRPFALAVLRFG